MALRTFTDRRQLRAGIRNADLDYNFQFLNDKIDEGGGGVGDFIPYFMRRGNKDICVLVYFGDSNCRTVGQLTYPGETGRFALSQNDNVRVWQPDDDPVYDPTTCRWRVVDPQASYMQGVPIPVNEPWLGYVRGGRGHTGYYAADMIQKMTGVDVYLWTCSSPGTVNGYWTASHATNDGYQNIQNGTYGVQAALAEIPNQTTTPKVDFVINMNGTNDSANFLPAPGWTDTYSEVMFAAVQDWVDDNSVAFGGQVLAYFHIEAAQPDVAPTNTTHYQSDFYGFELIDRKMNNQHVVVSSQGMAKDDALHFIGGVHWRFADVIAGHAVSGPMGKHTIREDTYVRSVNGRLQGDTLTGGEVAIEGLGEIVVSGTAVDYTEYKYDVSGGFRTWGLFQVDLDHTHDYDLWNWAVAGAGVQMPAVVLFGGEHTLMRGGSNFGMGTLFQAGGTIKNDAGTGGIVMTQFNGVVMNTTVLGQSYTVQMTRQTTYNDLMRFHTDGGSGGIALGEWVSYDTQGEMQASTGCDYRIHYRGRSPTGAGSVFKEAGLLLNLQGSTHTTDILLGTTDTGIDSANYAVWQGHDRARKWNGALIERFNQQGTAPSYSVSGTDYILTHNGGNSFYALPSASTNAGRILTFIVKWNSAGTVALIPNGSDKIDGATSRTINQGDSVTIVSNGSGNWYAMAETT